jgi:dephospho-CoA kinase
MMAGDCQGEPSAADHLVTLSPCHLVSSLTKPPVLGLIGGIGSGKSWVAEQLARRGARVISGDEAGHEALRQPAIRERIARRWGSQVLDERGEVDRRKLGAVVFADPGHRQELEALVFPWIERRLSDRIAAASAEPGVLLIVLDAAVLLEAGWDRLCDAIVYVHAPRPVRLGRVAQQRGWSAEEVEARERAQLPLTDKVTRADFVLENSGDRDQVARQVDQLVQNWTQAMK